MLAVPPAVRPPPAAPGRAGSAKVAERQRDKQPLPGAPQVYAITLYVDEAAAKLALAGHSGDEAVCEAVEEGAFTKALQVHS